jgi:hypothetical protein
MLCFIIGAVEADKQTIRAVLTFTIPFMIISGIVICLSIFISFKKFSTSFLKTTYIDVKDGTICGTIYTLNHNKSNWYKDYVYTLREEPFLIDIKSIIHTEIAKDPDDEEYFPGDYHAPKTLVECGLNIYYKNEKKTEVKILI